jgi:hypothetical protein
MDLKVIGWVGIWLMIGTSGGAVIVMVMNLRGSIKCWATDEGLAT